MHDDSMDYFRYCAFIQARNCGKAVLAKQSARDMFNSNYGLACTDDWVQRYLKVIDKVYDTVGIKDYLNKFYDDPMLKFKNGNYIDYDIDLIKEKNKKADQMKQIYFTIEDIKGNRYKITIEKDFHNIYSYPYRARIISLCSLKDNVTDLTFGYHWWEQLETQFMYDLAANDGIVVCTECRDEITCELKRAREQFSGLSSEFIDQLLNTPRSKAKSPFEAMPKIKKVIFNNPATIVFWRDGSKTIVKMNGKDKKFDPEKGLAMAIAKKCLGNEGNYYNTFTKFLPEKNADKKSADRRFR